MTTPKPAMQTQTQCTIPKGNYAQLSGSIANAGNIGSQVFVAWDRVDPGYEDFTDTSVARFAPREPSTRSLRRFLPNLYILSFQPTQLEEIAPQDGGGNQDMTFCFVGRTSFDPTASTTAAFSEELAATFGYTDVSLTFDHSVAPLQLLSVPAVLQGLQSVNLSWAGGGAGDSIEILVAVNTMTEVTSPDFNKVVEDLEFVSMGSFPNSGGAQVQVPSLENPNNLPVNLMIRSGSQECYYFDLAANLSYEEPVNLPPTTSPSAMPSSAPSRSPTPSPSAAPSVVPSSTPSTSSSTPMPSSAPSSDPSAGPTNLDTTSPTVSSAPTGSPSDSSSLRPSLAPTASPTILPSLKPSAAPTIIPPPSPSPVASPSTAPSSAPSNGPTVAQSASPSGSPSAVPTKNPTTSPTSSPTRAPSDDSTSCTVKEENVCGYSFNDKTDQVVPSHFSICILHHIPSNKYTSHCLGEADLLHLEAHQWLPGVLNPNDEVYTCGCCPEDDKSDYCQPRKMACPMHVYGGCDLGNNNGQGYGNVGMEVCLENKRGKRRTRCVSPFAEQDAKFAGCGRTCDEPALASNIYDHEIEV